MLYFISKLHQKMPYLKITCSVKYKENFKAISERLTSAINDLFFNSKAGMSREELRRRTTIHFVPYENYEMFIGGQSSDARKTADLTVKLSDWNMSAKQQRRVASLLTPVLAGCFKVPHSEIENINIRFHSYGPSDFAVDGKLLSDRIPFAGRFAKKLFGK